MLGIAVCAFFKTEPFENFFQIGVQADKIDEVKTDLAKVLRLMQLSIIHSREIDHETWESIRNSMIESRDIEFSAETGGADFGTELDLLATRPLGDGYSLLLKFADFQSDNASYPDTTKAWVMVTLDFQ